MKKTTESLKEISPQRKEQLRKEWDEFKKNMPDEMVIGSVTLRKEKFHNWFIYVGELELPIYGPKMYCPTCQIDMKQIPNPDKSFLTRFGLKMPSIFVEYYHCTVCKRIWRVNSKKYMVVTDTGARKK